ncbi:MAG: aspartate carbamoyltransferase regulatory subunit [Ruminococcaceae bacterium]|nr:aspartate carbamoyltransferase regulatory subunit [Oscillospiraceae bacterium]
MNIDSIKDGFVIDHITAGKGIRIYELLGLDKLDCPVAIIMNAGSKKMGKKDIIKIDGEVPLSLEVIGYADPKVTVNVIKDSTLSEKLKISMPETLTNVIFCKNPRCITSVEQEINHIFKLADKDENVYRCIYCESKSDL